jgi:hypothetical protein
MWNDLIGSPVMHTRRYSEAQGMMEEADTEIARLRKEHEDFVLNVAKHPAFAHETTDSQPARPYAWFRIEGGNFIFAQGDWPPAEPDDTAWEPLYYTSVQKTTADAYKAPSVSETGTEDRTKKESK